MSQTEKDYKKVVKRGGLIYVHDFLPGIFRKKCGKGFAYYWPNGKLVKDTPTKKRIKNLRIPPAYDNVWVCTFENGHIQAIGYDKKQRKQYQYHPKWREYRQEINYQRMIDFGQTLGLIRRIVDKDIKSEGLSKKKVLAAIVRVLDMTLIRVGNEKYAKENGSYGLTTIQKNHVHVENKKSGVFNFEFFGKSHKYNNIKIRNKKLYQIIQNCMELGGYELFQFLDHHEKIHDITSDDVNNYLEEISGGQFSAKDFRTWWGTVFTLIALEKFGPGSSKKEVKQSVLKAIRFTSKKLHNTPSVCRKFYIYPGILESFEEGKLSEIIQEFKNEKPNEELSHEEWWTLQFLKKKL
ncbi:MAG: DNA topoisomerase IB [Thermales bacterium]|nr:DNA topoisomerase IB [Thermales bacterium]